MTPVETADLGGNALSDRRQTRVGHDKAQFPQPSPAPPFAHHSHPFGGCSHFDLLGQPQHTVTRYGSCGNGSQKPAWATEAGRMEYVGGLQDDTRGIG